ncbi:chitin disaccharide deacetylase [Vibrio metoecus]|uniref:chitin disaccharide deacetylase n=1 Tax=Vibrio metoecus TaxID=1481663 RepID=UPI000BA9B67A|nr:chitin disaccharide deacetylase [Vibrio metoecus]PAR28467.1 chitooligosaccharide deacetylase [Vibrio metoecus]PAR62251.1 chitooligosaccharide deacetylase [Vibrio metoecus]
MKVIFNADDFGLTPGVNEGIVKAHHDGVVKSTTLMVGMDAEQHAVELAKQYPELKIGLHLRFTTGRPLTGEKNLTHENGLFTSYRDFWKRRDYQPLAIYHEAVAQVEHFLQLGLTLSHLDSHHHAHTHPQFAPIIYEVAQKYQVPLRTVGLAGEEAFGCRYHFTDFFYDERLSIERLVNHLLELKSRFELVEVMCHPAYVDALLEQCSGYTKQREEELRILTSSQLIQMLIMHDIEVTDYSALVSAPSHSCV